MNGHDPLLESANVPQCEKYLPLKQDDGQLLKTLVSVRHRELTRRSCCGPLPPTPRCVAGGVKSDPLIVRELLIVFLSCFQGLYWR